MKSTAEKLTEKQEAFCHFFIETCNASEAYRRAYNAENMGEATIWVKASELLNSDKVSVRVKELQKETAQRHNVTIDRIVGELASIAFADPGDYFTWEGGAVTLKPSEELTRAQRTAVVSVKEQTGNTNSVELKLSDKQAALEKLGKHLGMFVDRTKIEGDLTVNIDRDDAKL